jgi:hypothetical protein
MPFDPNSPFGPAGADGIDDWFVPGQSPDRIAPWTPQTDHFFPDDWISPVNRNAPTPPDPFAAYWALIPASRLTAVAWHPPIFPSSNPFSPENIPASKWVTPLPIFPNSFGQYPLPVPAPSTVSSDAAAGGLLGGIPKMLAAQAAANDPWNGLLGGIARLPYVSATARRSVKRRSVWPARRPGGTATREQRWARIAGGPIAWAAPGPQRSTTIAFRNLDQPCMVAPRDRTGQRQLRAKRGPRPRQFERAIRCVRHHSFFFSAAGSDRLPGR